MLHFIFTALLFVLAAAGKMSWSGTEYMFAFGDSYTYVLPPGYPSPVPGFVETSSNGPNWIQYLGGTYNSTTTQVVDVAYPGATVDSGLIPPTESYILSLVDQIAHFQQAYAGKPQTMPWADSNTLFIIWIGINDVRISQSWSNMTLPTRVRQLNKRVIDRLSLQVDSLYTSGARSFLFLTVPPLERSPLFLEQGRGATQRVAYAVADFNSQLSSSVQSFKARHNDLSQVTLFDTQPVFNTILDNYKTLGYVNITGYCGGYVNGTQDSNTQIEPCAPVSSYFWLNNIHPIYSVHNILAHAVATALST